MNSIARDLLGTQMEIRDMLLEIGGKGSFISTGKKKKKPSVFPTVMWKAELISICADSEFQSIEKRVLQSSSSDNIHFPLVL